MPVQQTDWTADMARALPADGKRYEVLDGILAVSPAPSLRHQVILMRLFRLIDAYVDAHRLGLTLLSPADIEFGPQLLLQPDLFVVANTGSGEPQSWSDVSSLLLAAEVTSPSTVRVDRGPKRVVYKRQVPEYWIIDGDRRFVERGRFGDDEVEVLDSVLEWRPSPTVPPLLIDVVNLLR